MIIYNTI